MLIIITAKESNSRTVTKQMPTQNEKRGPDLNSNIFPLQFRMLFHFCSCDFLDGGPVSSAGSTLSLLLLCRRSPCVRKFLTGLIMYIYPLKIKNIVLYCIVLFCLFGFGIEISSI